MSASALTTSSILSHSTGSLHPIVSRSLGIETRPLIQSVLTGHDVSRPPASFFLQPPSSLVPFGYTVGPMTLSTQLTSSLRGTVVGDPRDPTSTPRVRPPHVCGPQGRGGSPVPVAGTVGVSSAVQTGPTGVSGSGVRPPLDRPRYKRLRWHIPGMVILPDGSTTYQLDPNGPNSFLTREMLGKGLELLKKCFDVNARNIDAHLHEFYNELRRSDKGKGIAQDDQPTNQPPLRIQPNIPPPPQPTPATEDELKSQLYAHLLSRAHELNQEDADILMLLRRQLEETHSCYISRDELAKVTDSVNNLNTSLTNAISQLSSSVTSAISELNRQVTVLETTCR